MIRDESGKVSSHEQRKPERSRVAFDFEIVRNSRRSDRELAKEIGVSQPTVSRSLKKLRSRGYIGEYTMIPDFNKLRHQILAFSVYKPKENVTRNGIEEKRKSLREEFKKEPLSFILGMSGMDMNSDRIMVTLHEDYASYVKLQERVSSDPNVKMGEVDTFMVELESTNHMQILTLSALAEHMLKRKVQEQIQRAHGIFKPKLEHQAGSALKIPITHSSGPVSSSPA